MKQITKEELKEKLYGRPTMLNQYHFGLIVIGWLGLVVLPWLGFENRTITIISTILAFYGLFMCILKDIAETIKVGCLRGENRYLDIISEHAVNVCNRLAKERKNDK
jgi:hypothetical protein